MKHITFYEEFKDKRKGVSAGNCVAVIKENRWSTMHGTPIDKYGTPTIDVMFECVAGVFEHPDSPCVTTSISDRVLRASYKRCSPARAAKVHPNLLEYLKD